MPGLTKVFTEVCKVLRSEVDRSWLMVGGGGLLWQTLGLSVSISSTCVPGEGAVCQSAGATFD